jgi:group I intron endonuclease
MFLYQIRNTVSDRKYYGLATNPKRRLAGHRHSAKSKKTPLYDAIRSYGWETFVFEILVQGTDDYIAELEIKIIASDPNCYNLHLGGHIGFDVSTKSKEQVQEWKAKLSMARANKKPAQGMTHSKETKKICGEHGKMRWDIHGRYPVKVLDYGFAEASKKYGISKTHYYRLRKAMHA